MISIKTATKKYRNSYIHTKLDNFEKTAQDKQAINNLYI